MRAVKTKLLALLFVGVTDFPYDPALASDAHHNSASEIMFLLKGAIDPAIVTTTVPNDKSLLIMRLPDLSSINSKLNHKKHASKKVLQSISRTRIVKTDSRDLKNTETFVSRLNFKPEKITGVIRMPRVKFSSLEPIVELREELPSIDFTAKSLKDGGF